MSADHVRRWFTGAGIAGGAAVAAVLLGMGSAHAAPADDVVDAGASSAITDSGAAALWDNAAQMLASTNPQDLLSTAAADITETSKLIGGIDVSSGIATTYASFIDGYPSSLDTLGSFVTDQVAPAESTVSTHSGSLSGLVDQLFLDPLNQQWANTGAALLSAGQAFDSAITAGSTTDASTAMFQTLGILIFQMVPAAVESLPVMLGGAFLGDGAVGTAADVPDVVAGLF